MQQLFEFPTISKFKKEKMKRYEMVSVFDTFLMVKIDWTPTSKKGAKSLPWAISLYFGGMNYQYWMHFLNFNLIHFTTLKIYTCAYVQIYICMYGQLAKMGVELLLLRKLDIWGCSVQCNSTPEKQNETFSVINSALFVDFYTFALHST